MDSLITASTESWQHVSVPADLPTPKRLPQDIRGLDIARGLSRSGGRATVYLDLLHRFCADHQGTGSLLRRALRVGDMAAAQAVARNLRTGAAGVAAEDVQRKAAHLEEAVRRCNDTHEIEAALLQVEGCLAGLLPQLQAQLQH